MIGRILAATLTGGILAFVCGLLAWQVLPYHTDAMRTLGAPGPLPSGLQGLLPEAGVYRTDPGAGGAAVPLCVFVREGAELRSAERMGWMLAAAVGAAFAAVLVVAAGRPAASPYLRWLQFTLLGCFAALAGPAADGLRFGYSQAFAVPLLAGTVATWAVAGIGMAATLGGGRR
jgi:hypothetical protein